MRISEPKVMDSPAGFYVGRTHTVVDFIPGKTIQLPYSRESGYKYSRWEAAQLIGAVDIPDAIKETLEEIPRAKKLKSKLGKKRLVFLQEALVLFQEGKIPDFCWDYNA